MLLGEVALPALVPTKVHGEHKHAVHEDCVVPHTGPIHGPGVNVVCIGAHDNVPEHSIDCEYQIQMTVQGI